MCQYMLKWFKDNPKLETSLFVVTPVLFLVTPVLFLEAKASKGMHRVLY